MTRPNWGHGSNPPVPVFTEDEIRKVMLDHCPSLAHGVEDEVACTCGPSTTQRVDCLYCRVRLPGKHKKDCRRPRYPGAGETIYDRTVFDADHLIEVLKENRARH